MDAANRWKHAVQRVRERRREVELVGLAVVGFMFVIWVIAFRH